MIDVMFESEKTVFDVELNAGSPFPISRDLFMCIL